MDDRKRLERRLLLFFAVNYFAQGMSGIVYEPLAYFLKDTLKLSAAQSAGFWAWITAPFLIKPLFGILTDLVPILGRLRRPHLLAGAALGTAGWLALAGLPRPSYGVLVALFVLVNVAVVFTDVVCDGVMVERGKASGKTGFFQAVQIGTLYATLVATGLGGGWLSSYVSIRLIFAVCALFSLLSLVSAIWMPAEAPAPGASAGLRGLRALFCERRFWAVAALIFLFNFSPFLGTAQFYFQSVALKLSPLFIGALTTLGGFAGLAGAAFFGKVVGRRWSTAQLVRAAVWLGAPLSLLYLGCIGPVSAALLSVLFGFFGVVFRLALMDLAAQACPRHAEATAFAVFMSVFNLAAWASNTVGGMLYDRMTAAFSGQTWPAYMSAGTLILIGSACILACWPLVPQALAHDAKERPDGVSA